jgi:hypothetical protein
MKVGCGLLNKMACPVAMVEDDGRTDLQQSYRSATKLYALDKSRAVVVCVSATMVAECGH